MPTNKNNQIPINIMKTEKLTKNNFDEFEIFEQFKVSKSVISRNLRTGK